jgi:FkbM family methyltransferase
MSDIKTDNVISERAQAIAQVRGESIEEVRHKFSNDELSTAPRSFSRHISTLRDARFLETGVSDGMAYAKIPDGHVFYGFQSMPNHRRAYKFVQDLLPKEITEDTFLVAIDVAQRYATDFTWPPPEILPPSDGLVVECGAYLGHKTIRFAEELVPEGRVLAIEMMPDNVEILRKNIKENGLENRIDVMEYGVWDSPGELEVRGKGRQRNTLIELDKLSNDTGVIAKVDTLDNLLDSWGKNHIDLIFITVNGAEVEALKGLDRWLSKVGGMFVAAPYEREGRRCSDICVELLQKKGCTILSSSNPSRVIATSKTIRPKQ